MGTCCSCVGRRNVVVSLSFEVELQRDEDGGYVVGVPSLPGCVSQGETPEEAMSNIRDAIEGYLLSLVKDVTRDRR